MQAIDTLTIETDLGTLTLAYEGDAGSKAWTWRDASGEVVATQPTAGAMAAFKRQHTA